VGAKIEMDDFKLNPAVLRDGIYILTEINNEFESIYLNVRDKEKRIYFDNELLNLPFPSNNNPHKKEWNLRAKSYNRFKEYLRQKKENLNILDLGCGNGWFCGKLSNSFNQNFYCVDVNLAELKQGRRNFASEKINFIYADIFTAEFLNSFFDIIIMNAAVQYFRDLKPLLTRLISLSTEIGEIHILDSPIYSEDEAVKAKQRTRDYYSSMDFPKMSDRYHHHTWNEFNGISYKVLYNPLSVINKFKNVVRSDSPFPWIKITK